MAKSPLGAAAALAWDLPVRALRHAGFEQSATVPVVADGRAQMRGGVAGWGGGGPCMQDDFVGTPSGSCKFALFLCVCVLACV